MSKKITRRKELEFPYGDEKPGFEIPKLSISKSIDDIPNPKYYKPSNEKKQSNNKTGKSHPFEKFSKKKKEVSNHLKDKISDLFDDNRVYKSKPLGKKEKDITFKSIEEKKKKYVEKKSTFEVMPLNKYLAKCDICSRREAVEIIKAGRVKINKEVVMTPGFKIEEGMNVYLDDKKLTIQENKVYILLNKPKGYITTLDDPKGRRIVSDLYKHQISERIYPVGRLDRNTTGILIITNDGELSQQLTHPKFGVKKIYQVELDRKLNENDFQKIANGIELEDGFIKVDDIAYLEDKKTLGVEIHSGRNRIVRRIFEHLGYTVEKLDRVYFAGITKKNLPRGKWRHLTQQEIINLKHLGKSKKK